MIFLVGLFELQTSAHDRMFSWIPTAERKCLCVSRKAVLCWNCFHIRAVQSQCFIWNSVLIYINIWSRICNNKTYNNNTYNRVPVAAGRWGTVTTAVRPGQQIVPLASLAGLVLGDVRQPVVISRYRPPWKSTRNSLVPSRIAPLRSKAIWAMARSPTSTSNVKMKLSSNIWSKTNY